MLKEENITAEGRELTKAEAYNRKLQETPIWQKPLLTVVEAAKYFQIGEVNIRKITREHRNSDFVQWHGPRVLIRREPFERFLDSQNKI